MARSVIGSDISSSHLRKDSVDPFVAPHGETHRSPQIRQNFPQIRGGHRPGHASGLARHRCGALPAAPSAASLHPNSIAVQDLPKHYDVEPGVHNLENGYWGIMPREVAAEYARQIAFVNRNNSLWARNVLAWCLSCRGRTSRTGGHRAPGRLPGGRDRGHAQRFRGVTDAHRQLQEHQARRCGRVL